MNLVWIWKEVLESREIWWQNSNYTTIQVQKLKKKKTELRYELIEMVLNQELVKTFDLKMQKQVNPITNKHVSFASSRIKKNCIGGYSEGWKYINEEHLKCSQWLRCV